MSTLTLKDIIQNKLEEYQMNPSDLERKAGLAPSSIRKILLGTSQNPTLGTLNAISNVFHCSIDELVGRKPINTDKEKLKKAVQHDVEWKSELIQLIVDSTCNFIEENRLSPKFFCVISVISDTYTYCLDKKKGEFDASFHEWHLHKKLLDS